VTENLGNHLSKVESFGEVRLKEPGNKVINGWDNFFLMHYQNDDEELVEAGRKGEAWKSKRKNVLTVNVNQGSEVVEDEDSEPEKSGSRSRSGIVFLGIFWLMKKSLLIKVSREMLGKLFLGKGAQLPRTGSIRPRRF
jgi:hypothetical protein